MAMAGMKKLTEEWKVKKQKTGNRSFRELIDFNSSNSEDREKTPVRKGVSKPKSIPKTTNNSKVHNSSENEKCFSTLRRSIRLYHKAIENRKMKPDVSVQENQNSSASEITTVDENCINERANTKENLCNLSQWGLPLSIVEAYKSRNINQMFQWQYECLCMKDVLNGRNLVFSAPTSAGKTLVAEILMLKKVAETGKKAIMILPFVSVVREKVHYFQEMFQNAGIVVDGYMGAHNPPGGFKAIDVAICTIEKANNLINRLMEEKRLDELGILVVDEVHMLGDHSRGYLLELLLTKLLYNCKRNNIVVQIVGMSATLPNLKVLSTWLDSELYCTDFRPVPLLETFKIGSVVYDARTKEPFRDLKKSIVNFSDDVDHITCLSIETVTAGHGVLIFCPSKNWCENLATTIAKEIYTIGRPNAVSKGNVAYTVIGEKLREHLNGSQLNDIILQLKSSPAGLDSVLGLTVPFGVAFHHAGLTFDERDIVEGAFRQGIIKILVATSTLSSGVNLPARRVIIRSPMFCGNVIDVLSYKQMVGRAGRKGIDEKGESILLCKESERNAALTLVNSELPPVKSCLLKSGSSSVHSSLKRALIEVIASGVASSQKEVQKYISCTLLFASITSENETSGNNVEGSIEKCIEYLVDNDIIFKNVDTENDSNEVRYKPTRLGLAMLASGFSPDDALRVLKELQLARRCFVLENDLHILYEVTPPYLSDQMGALNWMHFLSLWEQLPEEYKRVGELVGVQENFIGLGIQGKLNKNSHKFFHRLAVHQRFYASLALNDLIQEMPLSVVAEKYDCTRGILQSLQQTTSTFAGMLTVFCNRLGWCNLELLFSSFQKRVHFGIQQELCDLVRLSTLNAQRARALYNAGFDTVSSLAGAAPDELALVLCNMGSFESAKQLEGELAKEILQRSKAKRIRITGKQGVDEKEAANLIIEEAQNFIKQELGISKVSWKHLAVKKYQGEYSSQSSHDRNNSKCSQDHSISNQTAMSLTSDHYPKIVRKVFVKETTENLKEQTSESQNTSKNVTASSKPIYDGGMVNSSMHENMPPNASSRPSQNFVCSSSDSEHHLPSNHVKLLEISKISNSSCVEPLLKGIVKSVNQSFPVQEVFLEKENEAVQSKNQFVPINDEKMDLHEKNISNFSKLSDKKLDLCNSVDVIDDAHFSELLLSQTAETENVYFAESFIADLETANINLSGRLSTYDAKNKEVSMKECPPPPVLSEDKNFNKSPPPNTLLNESDLFRSDSIFSMCLHNLSNLNENNREHMSLNVNKMKQNFENQLTTYNLMNDSHVSQISRLNIHSTPIQKSEKLASDLVSITNSFRKTFTEINHYTNRNNDCGMEESFNKSSSHCKKDLSVDETSGDIFYSDGSFNQDCLKENSNNDLCSENLHCKKDDVKLDKETSSDIFDEDSFSDVKEIHILPDKMGVSNLCSLQENQCSKAGEVNIESQLLKHNAQETRYEKNSISETFKEIYENKDHGLSIENNKTNRNPAESNFWNSWDPSDNSLNLLNIPQVDETLAKNKLLVTAQNEFFETKSEKNSVSKTVKEAKKNKVPGLLTENNKTRQIPEESNFWKAWDPSDISLNVSNIPHDDETIAKNKLLVTAQNKVLETKSEKNSVSKTVKETDENMEHGLSSENNKTRQIPEESYFWNSWDPSDNSLNLSSISQNDETLAKNTISNKEKVDLNNSENLMLDSADNSLFNSFTSDVLPPTPANNTAKKTQVSSRKVVDNDQCVDFLTTSYKKSKHEDDSFTEDKDVSKFFNPEDKITFRTLDIPDTELKEFFKKIAQMRRISISIACEKTAINHRSIGPPRSTKNSVARNEQCVVDQDVAVVGIAICYGGDAFYISISDQLATGKSVTFLPFPEKIRLIQDFFSNQLQCEILAAYDVKTQYKMLWQGFGISLKQKCVDPSIAAWLLDPALGQQSLRLLSHSFCPEAAYLLQNFDNNRGSLGLQHFSSIPGKQRASNEAFIVFHLIDRLFRTLKDQQLYKAFTNTEMPSILALAKMEQNGLGFNTALAVKYQKELQKRQQDILEKAYQMAGRRFNILSSKEVSRILYKELKLNPSITPNSPSTHRQLAVGTPTRSRRLPPELKTNKECLEKILHLHPLPKVILDWRRLSFATTKVLMPLLRKHRHNSFFDMDRLFATCYVYTLTGRINIHSPNLQFIPRDFNINNVLQDVADSEENSEEEYHCTDEVMSQFGVSLRDLFIPSTGNVLLSADYSQLELRILAHLSGDKKLIKSLNSGTDVFKTIAANWKSIPVESVSGELRQQAKKICYGMIYGISANTLSQQLNTTKKNASNFMETFRSCYPGLNVYFQSVIEKCSIHGYVSTLMHRRRYLSLIKSKNKSEQAHAERQAINTTIQGSAADLIKAAMIKIEKHLLGTFPETLMPYSSIQNSNIPSSGEKKVCRGGFLVLQMHDELIYEVNRGDLEVVLKIVKDAMEKTTKLSVKLPVNVRTGTSWGEIVEIS